MTEMVDMSGSDADQPEGLTADAMLDEQHPQGVEDHLGVLSLEDVVGGIPRRRTCWHVNFRICADSRPRISSARSRVR